MAASPSCADASSSAGGAAETPRDGRATETPRAIIHERKLVIFAHHRRVMDGLQAYLHAHGEALVRIDGSTPLPQRHVAIRRFQTEPTVRVALVSVTAAALGINLSAASECIFAELPPDAAWLAQAEDRCHRKGQKSAVIVTILLAHTPGYRSCGPEP